MSSAMVQIYVDLIQQSKITIDNVPANLRKEVEEILKRYTL